MRGQSTISNVIERSWPFWAQEFAIGFAAFSGDDIYRETGWLGAQMWKEWSGSGVYGPRGTDLSSDAAGDNAGDELAHYDMLRALVAIMDVPPPAHRPGPAAHALQDYRHGHWADPLLCHGVRMSEGGGLGLFHGAIAAIDARSNAFRQDDAVRAALAGIIVDEAGHLGGAIRSFLEAAVADPGPVLAVMEHCLILKVDERREQFAANRVDGVDLSAKLLSPYRRAIGRLLAAPE